MNTADIIRAILKHDGWTQTRLAEHFGATQPTISRWLKGSEPNGAIYEQIRELYRELEGEKSRKVEATPVEGIPNLDIHAGMGNGGAGHIEIDERTSRPLPQYTDGDWLFPPSFMQRIGTLKGKYAMPVEGDSMAPTIAAGSVVFVDTQRAYPSAPGLYVVDAGDGRLVKRVELIAGTDQIAIMSDNPSYRNYEFDREAVQIFGRVIAIFSFNE